MTALALASDPEPRRLLGSLSRRISRSVVTDHPLWRYTTLRVGGPADLYFRATNSDDLAEAVATAQLAGVPYFLLGGGSNVCISDRGVRGLVIHNDCAQCRAGEITIVDSGYNFMQLFLDSLQLNLTGLEFAVGIPGTVGGAMVSNAGAYRQNIDVLVQSIDVVESGERKTVGPEWMGFSYRDSRLRRPGGEPATIVSITLQLEPGDRGKILARARDNQRQRIFKQPWYPSAGSFFKNVNSKALADSLPDLPQGMKDAGVVPAGFLSAACGCRGLTVGGAQMSERHANFVINRGHATASQIRELKGIVKNRVLDRFGVDLEEEVLLVGDWD